MLRSKYKEALSVAQEAMKLFQSHGFRRNEGSAAMLLADAHRTMEQYREAQSAALQALNSFRLCAPWRGKRLGVRNVAPGSAGRAGAGGGAEAAGLFEAVLGAAAQSCTARRS